MLGITIVVIYGTGTALVYGYRKRMGFPFCDIITNAIYWPVLIPFNLIATIGDRFALYQMQKKEKRLLKEKMKTITTSAYR
jgi:hypothetical protein